MCDCDRALELISLRLDGELTPDEGRELDEHLEHCDPCRSLARDLAGIHAAMGAEEAVPEGFHQAVMDRVRESKVVPLVPKRRQWKSWAAMAAVFAVVLIGAQGLPDLLFRGGGASTAPMAPRTAMQDAAGAPAAAAAEDAPEPFSVDGGEPARDFSAPLEKDAAVTGRSQAGDGDGAAPAPAETAQIQSTGGTEPPQVALAQDPAGETAAPPEDALDQNSPRTTIFTALPGESSPQTVELTKEEALDKLLEVWPMPEGAQRVETGDELGWETPWRPVSEQDPEGQQVSDRLRFYRVSPNGRYYEFWYYSDLLDIPETGEGHASTLNFFAVRLDGTEILAQRHQDDTGPEDWLDYDKAISE